VVENVWRFVYRKEPNDERLLCFVSGSTIVALVMLLHEGITLNIQMRCCCNICTA